MKKMYLAVLVGLAIAITTVSRAQYAEGALGEGIVEPSNQTRNTPQNDMQFYIKSVYATTGSCLVDAKRVVDGVIFHADGGSCPRLRSNTWLMGHIERVAGVDMLFFKIGAPDANGVQRYSYGFFVSSQSQ